MKSYLQALFWSTLMILWIGVFLNLKSKAGKILGESNTSGIIEIGLEFNKGLNPEIKINEIKRKYGYAPAKLNNFGDYSIIYLDAAGNELDKEYFEIPNIIIPPPPRSGDNSQKEPIELNSKIFGKTLWWKSNGYKIEIRKNNIKIDERIVDSLEFSNQASPNYQSIYGNGLKNNINEPFVGPIMIGDDDSILDIAVISDNYGSEQALNTYFGPVVQRIGNRLLQYEPFKSKADRVRIHKINNLSPLGCGRHYPDIPRMVYCPDEYRVINAVNNAGVPWDTIAVAYHDPNYGGGGANLAVLSDNYLDPYNNADKVFVHEFGHSFGRLRDEYSYGGVSNEQAARNCWGPNPPPNPAWNGIVGSNNYYLECSYDNFYRTSVDSIMRTLGDSPFNAVSIMLINQQFAALIPSNTPTTPPTNTPSPTVTPTITPTITIAPTATLTPLPTVTPKATSALTTTPSLCQKCADDTSTKENGNANCDYNINLDDFVIWESEYKEYIEKEELKFDWKADFDCNGKVDLNDFSIWKEHRTGCSTEQDSC